MYRRYKRMDLAQVNKEVLESWKENKTFEESVRAREGAPSFTFYEGPPSANGLPGIHHVMARTIKDLICRYQTLKGKQVHRKAGWDTHGLPVELSVEKELGITKEDIGKKISVEEYNRKCRENVMKYKGTWEDLTQKMGYWVDMSDPYVTYDNKYIESVWWLLAQLYEKDLLYKGHTIQPYSPAAGTGLSTHELNQPGTYRDVTDTTVVAQFKVIRNVQSAFLYEGTEQELFLLAWTTTPWTLPSNTALTVGKKITYVKVHTFNPYTYKPIAVVLAKDLLYKYFSEENAGLELTSYNEGDAKIPYEIAGELKGTDMEGLRYEQLLPYAQPENGDAFRVLVGDFVTTEDGTGIVHTAPSFGADDAKVARENGIGSLTLVDMQGRFKEEVTDFSGHYVKNEYYEEGKAPKKSVDVQIAIKLKEENKAFKVEKYVHNYPHCWRTDKPVLYYPLESWFVKTTAFKDRMIELNKTINWKPRSTGEGRFGEWLKNLVDWNLSRSRFWGIPIPIWRTEDGEEERVIASAEDLKTAIETSMQAGFMSENPLAGFQPGDFSKANYETFDFHKPYIDDVVLVSPSGKAMRREADLIDVWFDSGAMPYAQLHYPFENKELVDGGTHYPADFIAEGVDQTRGWFFTLHAIASLLFDSTAYKNVISNGLVLDREGQKMSKRLGNAIDPFKTIDAFGADATRWYMIVNAQPWDNLRFDIGGVEEVQRKFFGTLYNTYSFFGLYATIDSFRYAEEEVPLEERSELDRWILSELHSLIGEVDTYYSDYEPTKAARAIQHFVTENLSNWYVRLSRRRFWKGTYEQDKIAAYQTLYSCLVTVAKLSAPIAPFFMDRLFEDLNSETGKDPAKSVHLSDFPVANPDVIDAELQERMHKAQLATTMGLSLRKRQYIKVRQPLQKIMIPVLDEKSRKQLEAVKPLILSELNVKEMELLTDTAGVLVKQIKPNFKTLGPKYGSRMKAIAAAIGKFTQEDITAIETSGTYVLNLEEGALRISLEDVEISSKDIPGWLVSNLEGMTLALDVTITEPLRQEGVARELVNRIQNMRKQKGLVVTDRILLHIQKNDRIDQAIANNLEYICNETLAENLKMVEKTPENPFSVEFDDVKTYIALEKID